jgi:hypothetical protein
MKEEPAPTPNRMQARSPHPYEVMASSAASAVGMVQTPGVINEAHDES